MTVLCLQDTPANMKPFLLLSSDVSKKGERKSGATTCLRTVIIFMEQSKMGKYGRTEAGNTGREQVPESSLIKLPAKNQTPGFLVS